MKILEAIFTYFRKLDKLLFLACAALSVFSVVLLWAIVADNAATVEVGSSLYRNQGLAVVISWALTLVLCAVDYHHTLKLWVLYVPVAIVLSLLVFTSLGIEVADDKAWIDLGFITIQPSELLKVAFITTFALHLSKVGDRINNIFNVLLLLLHAAVPLGIVVLQGDDGTATVFLVIVVVMLFSAGISWLYILPCVLLLPAGLYFVWTYVMKDFQKMRFLVLFDEELDPLGVGYHQRIAKTALGSGQVFGKGLTGGDYVQVPEAANDFIFTFIGQAFGFVGCVAVMAVLTFICVKVMGNSRISRDPLGRYLCMGVYAMICTHIILNLGMVMGVLPVIGVPLPFLSQGGTSVLSVYIGIGLVMSVYSHSETKYRMFYDEE
jgi:rod shape determining protein RodA